jgi:hypothetical protein
MEYKPVDESMKSKISDYIAQDVFGALYLALNFERYGLENETITFWYSGQTDSISSVVMKYNQSIQMLSVNGDFPRNSFIELIHENNPSIVTGDEKNILILKDDLPNYTFEAGYVSVKDKNTEMFSDKSKEALVEIATLKDMGEIAELICSDRAFRSYSHIDQLEAELGERLKSGYSRNYVIRVDSKIIAHYATYAENKNIAVVSGVIVDDRYQGQRYSLAVSQKLFRDLLKEGKIICDVRYKDSKYSSMLVKGGFKVKRNCAKLVKKA